jgi:hypothetical protein
LGNVISNSASGTTGTLVFQILSGNVPVTGALITVVGCSNSAHFNVTNVSVTVVSTTDAGICTVTYAITSTSQASTADSGQVIIPQPEIGELMSTLIVAYDGTNMASIPAVMPYNGVTFNLNQAITAVVSFPVLPTACTVVLQQAVLDIDSEYATVATVATVAGSTVTAGGQITVDPTLGRFFRLYVSGITVGSGKIVGKLLM